MVAMAIEGYAEFRTGLNFRAVLWELKGEAAQVFEAEGRRMFVTRRTVLGRMRQHKLTAYDHYRRYMLEGGGVEDAAAADAGAEAWTPCAEWY